MCDWNMLSKSEKFKNLVAVGKRNNFLRTEIRKQQTRDVSKENEKSEFL